MPAKRSKPKATRSKREPTKGMHITQTATKLVFRDYEKTVWKDFEKVLVSVVKGLGVDSVKVHFDEPGMKRSLTLVFDEDEIRRKYGIRLEGGRGTAPFPVAKKIFVSSKGFDLEIEVEGITLAFFHTNAMHISGEPKMIAALAGHLQKLFPKAKLKIAIE